MSAYKVAADNEPDSPWDGMTPVECIQTLMFYIRCVLQGTGCDRWFSQVPDNTFRPPFASTNNEKFELFRTVLLALCTPTEPLSDAQLNEFYASAIIARVLPRITEHSGEPVSWFVQERNNGWWYSVFLYSERLHSQVLSQDALYPMEYNHSHKPANGGRRSWWGTREVDVIPHNTHNRNTMMALDGIATLIKHIGNKGKLPCLQEQCCVYANRAMCPLTRNADGIPSAPGGT